MSVSVDPHILPIRASRLLVVEDDPTIAKFLRTGLVAEGFDVSHAADGPSGIALATKFAFNLIILDLRLPGKSGFEVLKAVRTRATPVIVLTALDDLATRMTAFELGAVDYLGKPFWIEELLARIRLRLQDAPDRSIPPIRWANAEFDFDTLETSVDGNRVELTPYERGILTHLLRHPGRPVTRLQLIESALPGTDCSERTIDAHVARLRRKLGPAASGAIKTMRGVGYRFDR